MLISQLVEAALAAPRERAFRERFGAPQWRSTSSTQMWARALAVAAALRAASLSRGDRVVLIAANSVDWLAINFGIHAAGCVAVPVFATLALDQLDYIFRDSAARLAFVETKALTDRIRSGCPAAPPRLIHIDGTVADSLFAFEKAGAARAAADPGSVASFTADVDGGDLAVLIYTSGTTGNPKGVMLQHDNLIANAESSSQYNMRTVLAAGEPVLSVLPFAHIYEHNNVLGYLLAGAEIYVSGPDYLLRDVKSVRPKFMAFVPRMFERILNGIVVEASAAGGVRARLVPWALNAGRKYRAAATGSRPSPLLRLQYALAHRLVLSKIRSAAGLDRVAMIVSGSAPLHRDIALTFAGIGVPIMEGYGLTETSPVLTGSRGSAYRYGSVGKPIPGVRLAIAPDGEILAKGPNVMRGYYNLPAEQPFTPDGWFKTGDIGHFDADGFLYITDRKKELIKTSSGKYVAPARVESALKRSSFVGQCFVVGDGRPFPIALVCPSADAVRTELGLGADIPLADLAGRSDVLELVVREVREKTADLAAFEQIRRVALLPRDLTIEHGELSPTMKIKRRIVEQKYAALIEAAYAPANKAV